MQVCRLDIEDEAHFILYCPVLHGLREKYLPNKFHQNPNINKFNVLMSSKSEKIINAVATYLYHADARPTELPRPAKKFKVGVLFRQQSGKPSQGQCHRFDTRWRRYSSPSHKRPLVVQNLALSSSNRPDMTEILFKGALNR